MLVTERTKRVSAFRKEQRDMKKAGYERIEGDWRLHRGDLYDHVITDVKISVDGKYLYYKLGEELSTNNSAETKE